MQTNLQIFLGKTQDWESVLSDKKIRVSKKDGLILLKYLPGADFSDPLVLECRGVILYESDFSFACRPFEKFFNVGEVYAADIDWDTAVVSEKIDGSLIKVWFNLLTGRWVVSTNGSIYAHEAYSGDVSFGEIFRNALGDSYFPYGLRQDVTYLFEVCSPYNRIVVPHNDVFCVHIGTRENESGRFIWDSCLDNFLTPRTFPLRTEDDVTLAAGNLGFDNEGFVVRDAFDNFVKIKSPEYVRVHRLYSNGVLTDKKVLTILSEREKDEYLAYFPEHADRFDLVETAIEGLRRKFETVRDVVDGTAFRSRGHFAKYALETTIPAAAFLYYDGSVITFDDWWDGLPLSKQESYIEKIIR